MVCSPSLWPSPPHITMHGCFRWAGSKLHIRTVLSKDAEAKILGDQGEVARPLMACGVSGTSVQGQTSPYLAMAGKTL